MSVLRKKLLEGVNFNHIYTSKFKTTRVSVTMLMPLEKDTAAALTILPAMLTRSCKKYPDFTMLNHELDKLYGADIYSQARKIGENLGITVSMNFIDDKFTIDNENISEKLFYLLCEIIFEPKIIDGKFDSDELEIEKAQLMDSIIAEYNDKRSYSIKKMVSTMCADEPFGIDHYGSYDNVSELTGEDVYNAWKNMLSHAKFEIFVISNCSDTSLYENMFSSRFVDIERMVIEPKTGCKQDVLEPKEVIEQDDVSQSKLVMGFRTKFAEPADTYAVRLACDILGGNTTSKFFTNIREKQSLCYYCASRFYKNKGILIVDSGVETANIEKTKNEVLKNIKALQNGELTEYEINSAKLSMTNHFKMMTDTTSHIEMWYISQLLSEEFLTPDQASERIMNVTADDVIKASKSISLDTTFVLKGRE